MQLASFLIASLFVEHSVRLWKKLNVRMALNQNIFQNRVVDKQIDADTVLLTLATTAEGYNFLRPNATYTVVLPENAVVNDEGTGNKAFASTFSTVRDDIAPTVTATTPADDTKKIELDTEIQVKFSELMMAKDLSRVVLTDEKGNQVALHVSLPYATDTLTITLPDVPDVGTHYTLSVPQGAVTDLGGNELAQDCTVHFQTTHKKLKDKEKD
jgi:hypothetical protein